MTRSSSLRGALAARRVRSVRSESGQAAGVESVPFGILVFVGGMLLVVNVWAVVDTRAALDSAARDYLRAYTSSPDSASARQRGGAAAHRSLDGRSSSEHLRIVDPAGPFGPCRPATVTLELEVRSLHAPFIGSIGTSVVSTTQTELVQPFADAIDEGSPTQRTPCDG